MDTIKVHGPAGTYEVPIHRAPLATRILQGMALPSGIFLLRMIGAGGAGASLRHVLAIASMAAVGGGAGGAVYYATDPWRVRGGVAKTLANVLSLLVYGLLTMFLFLWVVGLD